MDSLAAQYRFWTSDVSEITDAEWVEAALNGDRDSASYILQESCRRLRHRAKHPVVQLLGGLAFGEIPLKELQKQKLVKDILRNDNYKKFLQSNRTKLGDDYFHYLENCFRRTIDEYIRPRRENNEKRRRANWLAIGFYLAWAKKDAANQSNLQERNADLTQSIHFIIDAYNSGSLQNGVDRYLAGDSDVLPRSIERLIKLKGYVGGGPYIEDSRKAVSKACLKIFKKIEKEKDHRSLKIASSIYIKCAKACKTHLLRILKDLATNNRKGRNDDEISRLQERIGNLASFGAKERRKGNKGTGQAGLEKVYSKNQYRLPAPDRRRTKPKTPEQLEAEYSLLLEMPVIGDAVRLIDSPAVNNATGKALAKLEKRTPTGTEHMWPDIWKVFHRALARVAEQENEASNSW